jgi:hypothetical protein
LSIGQLTDRYVHVARMDAERSVKIPRNNIPDGGSPGHPTGRWSDVIRLKQAEQPITRRGTTRRLVDD